MTTYLLISGSDINQALATLLTNHGHNVIIASRSQPQGLHQLHLRLGDDSEENHQHLVDTTLHHQVDYVISSIGLLHDNHHAPEKSVSQLQADWFLENITINCLFNLQLLAKLTQQLPRHSQLKFIAFSARVGSISDNRLGGWLSYRVSKAALNMGIKTVAIEWQRLFKQAAVIGYHPGTVRTKLSTPFLNRAKTIFTPIQAADYLIQFLPTITPDMSGAIYDWQQQLIAY